MHARVDVEKKTAKRVESHKFLTNGWIIQGNQKNEVTIYRKDLIRIQVDKERGSPRAPLLPYFPSYSTSGNTQLKYGSTLYTH
mgnify:CR=1 FL=1